MGELYYTPYEIYGDKLEETEEAVGGMAHSSGLWSLCDNTPPFQGNPMLHSEKEYDQHVIKMNQRLAYQGVLDKCNDVGITKSNCKKLRHR